MLKSKFLTPSLFLSLGLLGILGCADGGPPDERPDRVVFGGTAKLNGSAVTDALITFHPTGADGRGASGKTDSRGKFQMSTFEANDGVIPGDYAVTVTKTSAAQQAAAEVDVDDPAYDGAPAEESVDSTNNLPPQFEDPKTSGVKVSVTEANTEYELEFK